MQKTKRILILGPESTGKSTLAEDLAHHFGEPWVPEFAREYLEKIDRPYRFEDLVEIGKGQVLLEDQQAEKAKNFLFCDTDLRVIHIWSEHRFHGTPFLLLRLPNWNNQQLWCPEHLLSHLHKRRKGQSTKWKEKSFSCLSQCDIIPIELTSLKGKKIK